jgi:uncharacterized protein (DUF433 family)
MDPAPIDIATLISRSPDVKAGRPYLSGTGVTVHRVIGWYKQGLSAEEIMREIEHLRPAQVYAALAYYHANKEEIERILADEEADYERFHAELSRGKQLKRVA